MSSLIGGADINAGGTGEPDMTSAVDFWRNTLGLPCTCSKLFFGTVGYYPTTIGGTAQQYINNNVGFIPCFKPTYPAVSGEVTQLLNSVNMWRNAGATIPCVVLYSEVNSGNALTPSQYLSIANAFQSIRSTVPLYIDFAGSAPIKGPNYWDAAYHDGIGIDFYTSDYNNNRLIDWANNLSIAAGIPFGVFELGNDSTTLASAPFPAMMSYVTNLFQTRINNGQPIAPCMWWENTSSGSGNAHITVTTNSVPGGDPRVPAIKTFFDVLASAGGSYNVTDLSLGTSGTTLVATVGTGSLGGEQGTAAGDLVSVVITTPVASQSITRVVDSKGNTYTLANSFVAASGQHSQWVYVSKATTALVAGTDTITVTFGASNTNRSMIVRGCPGVASATPDVAVVASGNNASPSVTGGTLATPDELVIGAIASGSGTSAPSNVPFGNPQTIKQDNYLTEFDNLVDSTAALTASASITSGVWSATLTTFKLSIGVPTVTTTSLSPGVVGTAYSTTLSARNGTQPYTWTLASGTLPAGLTLNSNGTITGTPTTSGTATLTFTVTDANSNTATSGSLSLVIAGGALTVTTPALPNGTTGATYSATETESGGTSPFTWAVTSGSLPPDLSLSTAGVFSGTPTVAGVYPFTVQVTDSSGATSSASQQITVDVPSGVDTAIAAIALDVSGVLQTGHDKAHPAHGVSAAPTVSSGTLSQAEEQVLAFSANTNAGGNPAWAIGWTPLSNQGDGGSAVIIGAAYQTVTSVASVTASDTITSAPWAIGIITEPVVPPSLSTLLSNGIVGEPYSQTLETTGGLGTYTYGVTSGSLPPGLTLAGNVVSGTPTTAGEYVFTITATDSHGFAATEGEDVTIVVDSSSPATPQPMHGNILSTVDSDFSTGVGSWVAGTNAQGIATTTNAALVGPQSLRWIATSDGSTTIKSGLYGGIVPGKTYVVSSNVLATSNQAPNLWITVKFYDASNTILSSTDNGGAALLNPLRWQGIQAVAVAPAGATQAKIFIEVDAANAGDLNYLDLNFFAATQAQVLIDFVNPAFGAMSVAGGNFMDVTPWVRLDQGINLQRGRQFAIDEISSGQSSFVLQNDGGWFTDNNIDSGPVAMGGQVSLGARVQINFADQNGVWHTRCDGQVSQINYALDPTGNTNLATFNVADVLAPLSRQDPLQCWTKEQVLANGPQWHWTLDDTPNATSTQSSTTTGGTTTTTTTTSDGLYYLAGEGSGNNGPPLKVVRSAVGATATIAWQDSSGGVETLADAFAPGEPDGSAYWPAGSRMPSSAIRGLDSGAVGPISTPMQSVYFTPELTPAAAKNAFVSNRGYHLQAFLPTLLNPDSTPGGDFSVEAWFTIDPSVVANVTQNYGPYTVFSLTSSRRGTSTLVAGVFQPSSGNIPAAGAALYANAPDYAALNFGVAGAGPTHTAYSALPEADTVLRPHHLVVKVTGDPSTPQATVYVDGNWQGDFNLPAGTTFDTISVGGTGKTGCFYGNISMVSIYPYALSWSQIILDCQLGQYGMWELPTDDCIAQLGQYANIPSFWNGLTPQHNGLSLTDYYNIAGSNAYTAMTIYEQTEGGLLFVNAAGQLTFHTRDWRMGYGAPKLNLPPDSYGAALSPAVLDTAQQNEDAIASAVLSAGAFYVNQASQEQYGTYATNPVGSPVQLAHTSYSRGYGTAGLQEQTFWPDPNMLDAAAWQANSNAAPTLSLGSIVVDMLTVDPTWGVSISDFYSVDIGDVLSLTGTLPDSMPNGTNATEYFIEGISETFTLSRGGTNTRTVTYYVTPASAQRAWIPGDSTYGVLGSTARIGVSAADVSTPQADGKTVSHDGGPPYWSPTFATGMNSPGANNNGFVGMNDIRGLIWPLQQMLTPPMAATAASSNTQSVPAGPNTEPQLFFDSLGADSSNGMGIMPGWPNWWVCLVPGFYEIDGQIVGNTPASGGDGWQGWIVVAQGAAETVAAGIGGPDTVAQYVCPIGETVRESTLGPDVVAAPSTRVYLGLGDMVTLAAEQGSSGAQLTSVNNVGSGMSLRFVGLCTQDDRCQINTSLSNGGSVSGVTPITHGTNTYQALHTFAHFGYAAQGNRPWTLRNKDLDCYTGTYGGDFSSVGPQYTLVRFDWVQILADLAAKSITSVTLKGTNAGTDYPTGANLMVGYYYTNNESGTWQPNLQNPGPQKNLFKQWFKRGQTLTFSIPAQQFQQYFIEGQAHGIILGDNSTMGYGDSGAWNGGPNSWTLKVSY